MKKIKMTKSADGYLAGMVYELANKLADKYLSQDIAVEIGAEKEPEDDNR